MTERSKTGVISCSGEDLAAGTVARSAVRRVLEKLRPQSTVTLCLPLFLAGDEAERRFAREHPTITVDGCDKLCAKRGTEQYSGRVAASLVVTDLLGDRLTGCHRSQRDFTRADEEAVWIVADHVAASVDELAATAPAAGPVEDGARPAAACSCGGSSPGGNLTVAGRAVAVNGLPLILEALYRRGLAPDESSADRLLETVRIYHPVAEGEEPAYRTALVAAYRTYCRQRAGKKRCLEL